MRRARVLLRDASVASRLIADGFELAPADAPSATEPPGTLDPLSTPEPPGTTDPLSTLEPLSITEPPGTLEPLSVIVCELISPASGSFIDTPDWARIVSESVAAPFEQVRQALPQLRLGFDARIIFVIDGWRASALPQSTAAVAANGALIALVKTLARDLGGDAITVNAIARGSGLPHAVSYLASPLAGALTGQVLTLGSGGEIRP